MFIANGVRTEMDLGLKVLYSTHLLLYSSGFILQACAALFTIISHYCAS